MTKSFLYGTVASFALASAAIAEVPSVAADITPIHSLVAMVMEGVGTPSLIVRPGASPHGYSLRPSEAGALQEADIVFWVSASLTPWLEDSIDALGHNAKAVELLEVDGTTELIFREGATFEGHDHEDEGHDEHAEEDHEDHGDEAHEDHEDEGHDGHDHEGHDPHAWLDPENARIWLDVIAAELSALDPENAETYAANAAARKVELATLITEINTDLEDFHGTNFIVFHDGYQYFENRFDIHAAGAIKLADASDASPARIAEIRDTVVELGITCAFAEPQFNAGLLQSVFAGTTAVIGVLDPLGTDLEIGPDFYTELLRLMTRDLNACSK